MIEMKRISVLLLLVVLAAGSVWAQNKVLLLQNPENGNRDYVEIETSNSLQIFDSITIEALAKITNYSRDMTLIHKKNPSAKGRNDFFLGFRLEKAIDEKSYESIFTVHLNMKNTQVSLEKNFILELDKWYHYSVTFNHLTGKLETYISGIKFSEKVSNDKIDFNNNPWFIGVDTDSALIFFEGKDSGWNGEIDEVREV